MPDFSLCNRDRPLLIAEVGNNHEGDFALAQRLVRLAKRSGAAAVKFQTFRTERFVSQEDAARFQRLKSFELTYDQFAELAKLAKSEGLLFISTPLDLESADFLSSIVDAFKIASGDNNFFPLLDRVCSYDKPLIISTGLSNLADVKTAHAFVTAKKKERKLPLDLAILHCVSAYPLPAAQANLLSIPFLKEELGCTIGYSDHAEGIEVSLAAVALGAEIIEKHFTIDKHYSDFRDHLLSADPADLKILAERLGLYSAVRGALKKEMQEAETPVVPLARRSIALNCALKKGSRISLEHLTWIRPGRGIPPGNEREVLGKTLKVNAPEGAILTPEMLS